MDVKLETKRSTKTAGHRTGIGANDDFSGYKALVRRIRQSSSAGGNSETVQNSTGAATGGTHLPTVSNSANATPQAPQSLPADPTHAEAEVEAQRAADELIGPENAVAMTTQFKRHERPAPAGVSQLSGHGGRPLPPATSAWFGARLGYDFSTVRVHTDTTAQAAARSVGAEAFTYGNSVYFAQDRYQPLTHAGRRLLAHELAHTVQQSAAGRATVQCHNPTDTRLPLDQAEALAFATASDTAVQAALTALGSDSDPARSNVPAQVTQENLNVMPLTPRHDSPLSASTIHFFPGHNNYVGSVNLPQETTYHVGGPGDGSIYVRARDHGDVDNLLPSHDIENRLFAAVAQWSEEMAVGPTAVTRTNFDDYRTRFNALWDVPPYWSMSDFYNPALPPRGPRSERSRAIFLHILDVVPNLASAYDSSADLRELVDAYMGREGLNLINSPGLARLRKVFFPYPTPITSATAFAQFRTAIQTTSTGLAPGDRTAVEESNDWQRLINDHVTDEARRAEIRDIIATPPAAPTPATPPPTAPVTPPTGSGIQAFLDGVTILGPTPTPVVAVNRDEYLTFTPNSPAANPGVTVDTEFRAQPPTRFSGGHTSPQSPWPHGVAQGAAWTATMPVNGLVTVDAELHLLNEPSGLTRTGGPARMRFDVQDNRLANLLTHWQPALNYWDGSVQSLYSAGSSTVEYVGGNQTFELFAQLQSGLVNPALALSVSASIVRVSTGNVIGGPQTEVLPSGDDANAPISMSVTAPSPAPAVAETLNMVVELFDPVSGTVHGTPQTVPVSVLPQPTFSQAAAQTQWGFDNTWFQDTAAPASGVRGGLLGQLTALGGVYANFADAVSRSSIRLLPFLLRHDSAGYVTIANSGTPNPRKAAYFAAATYGSHPDPNTFIADVGGAAYAGPHIVAVGLTTRLTPLQQRSDAEVQLLAVHEGVHALDITPATASTTRTDLERYKMEFRAYWTDGRYGPPTLADCSTYAGSGRCEDAMFDPFITPATPGPKSERARAIFSEQLYGSNLYTFVKPAYDDNVGGFREEVDRYLVPDGINLLISHRMETLRALIAAGPTPNFGALQTSVEGFYQIGPAPAVGHLQPNEVDIIQRSRAWRDFVERSVTNIPNRGTLKGIMGIP